MISRWHATLRRDGVGGRPLSSRSVQYASTILKMALTDATESGKLAATPYSEIPRRQHPTHKATQDVGRVWDLDQAKIFLAAVQDDRLSALWGLLLATGCRRGEALALRWSDLDLDQAVMTIARSRGSVSGTIVEGTPKNGKVRTLDLDPATIASLRKWRARVAAERLRAGEAYATDDDHVFCNELGEALVPNTISARFAAIVAKLDIPRISIHGTRHTSGTLALTNGTPVHVVAARLGHDPAVLLRTYSHLLATSGKDCATRLGSALFGAATS
jgi:integrase